ncbi:hypothetical protein AVEN_258629-1 [Araneus ventricosus]|uniref:Uncharacterized protein n=1 Tax=Araneus ventricosus TaxID=182803 RepID=A0A4Y2HMT8_ARAVE|nr:hypothetical protein AVEN_258629-1 [Araneus ventricosus]
MGVWRNSSTRRIMENEDLFTNIQKKHVAQVTGTITLVQISNTNIQEFTRNNSNSTFGFRNINSRQITNNDSNNTFNSAQLIGFPARTTEETPKSFLEGVLTPFIYPCSTGRDVTWNYLAHSSISSPNRDIEKIIAFWESSICRQTLQNGRQGQRSKLGRCRPFHVYPCKTLFPTIKLARQESDIASL